MVTIQANQKTRLRNNHLSDQLNDIGGIGFGAPYYNAFFLSWKMKIFSKKYENKKEIASAIPSIPLISDVNFSGRAVGKFFDAQPLGLVQ